MITVGDIDKNVSILSTRYINNPDSKIDTIQDLKNTILDLYAKIGKTPYQEVYCDDKGIKVINNFIATELSGLSSISVENLYSKVSKEGYRTEDYVISNLPMFIDAISVNDGYDTEILFRNTVSNLVDMYKDRVSVYPWYEELFEGSQPELWKGYWNQSLGNILLSNANNFQEISEDLSEDEIIEYY